MATLELNKDNFQQVINDNANVIIDFWAPWCAPCRGFAPTFEATSEKQPGIVFAKVNTEEQQEIAGAFNIRSIPTLMFFRDQIIIYSEAGALPASAFASSLEVKSIRSTLSLSTPNSLLKRSHFSSLTNSISCL